MFGLKFFQKQKKYCSCNLIEHGLDFAPYRINLCCRVPIEKMRTILNSFNGNSKDIDEIFKIKRQQRKQVKNGHLFPECKGCIYLEEKIWDNEDYISYINFNNWMCCNLTCDYCHLDELKPQIKDQYNIYPFIKNMLEKGYLKNDGEITIAGGEPVLAPEFEDLLTLLINNNFAPIRVLSNSTVYSSAIEKGVQSGQVTVCTSIDAGTKEMYQQIKGIDFFDKVWNNLKKYSSVKASPNFVIAKYILIPNCNDKKEEIDEFVKKVLDADIKKVSLDVELNWFEANKDNLPESLLKIFNYAVDLFKRNNLEIEFICRGEILRQKLNL